MKVLNKISFLMAMILVLELSSCSTFQDYKFKDSMTNTYEQEQVSSDVDNLAKLCRVWGYLKYRHPAFLLGKYNWDAELMSLIPKAITTHSNENFNMILHEWFVSLGEVDYKMRVPKESSSNAMNITESDLTWTNDTSYLGEALVNDLALLPSILPTMLDRTAAPVFFDQLGVPIFSNETEPNIDYEDVNFRLVGLFRLWNVLEYFYPYLHLTDSNWNSVLLEAIPMMLKATDQKSYEEVISYVAMKLQDPHTQLKATTKGKELQYTPIDGMYYLPVSVTNMNGALVITGAAENCPLQQGDLLLSINGMSINELAARKEKYYSLSREEYLLTGVCRAILNSTRKKIDVVVQRNQNVLSVSVEGAAHYISDFKNKANNLPPYQIVDGNIGILNLGVVQTEDELLDVMKALKNTDALIVDLRQYPSVMGIYFFIPFFYKPSIVVSKPASASPGTYYKQTVLCGYDSSLLSYSSDYYPYENPVVVLINQDTISRGEYLTTILKESDNVTIIGEPSAGTDGNVAFLPIPGEIQLQFTSFGIYTIDGRQTQRVGIQPDIYVHRSIDGIKNGQDELIEFALKKLRE